MAFGKGIGRQVAMHRLPCMSSALKSCSLDDYVRLLYHTTTECAIASFCESVGHANNCYALIATSLVWAP